MKDWQITLIVLLGLLVLYALVFTWVNSKSNSNARVNSNANSVCNAWDEIIYQNTGMMGPNASANKIEIAKRGCGKFFEVKDFGINCITTPCPAAYLVEIDKHKYQEIKNNNIRYDELLKKNHKNPMDYNRCSSGHYYYHNSCGSKF